MREDQLFRSQAVAANAGSRLGEISIVQPLAIWLIVGFSLLVFLTAVVFLVLGEYSQKTDVSGRLVNTKGVSTILSSVSGTLSSMAVTEGSDVQRGQVLAVVETERNLKDGQGASRAVIHSLDQRRLSLSKEIKDQDDLYTEQRQSLIGQRKNLQIELNNIEREVDIRLRQVELSGNTLQRLKSLVDQQYVSQLQVAQQEQVLLEQQIGVAAAQRNLATQRRNLLQVDQSLAELPTRTRITQRQARREIAGIEEQLVAESANAMSSIVARFSGSISNKLVEEGQAVQAGQPLMTILPRDSDLQAHLIIPSSAVGLVKPGDEVLLRYRAFPYQKFGQHRGVVLEVGRTALSLKEFSAITGKSEVDNSYYRLIVRLDSQKINAGRKIYALRPGMDVDAKIVGESMSLWKWLIKGEV